MGIRLKRPKTTLSSYSELFFDSHCLLTQYPVSLYLKDRVGWSNRSMTNAVLLLLIKCPKHFDLHFLPVKWYWLHSSERNVEMCKKSHSVWYREKKIIFFLNCTFFLPAQAFLPVSSFLITAFLSMLHLVFLCFFFFFFRKRYFKVWERFSLLNSKSNFLHLFMAAITFLHCVRIRLAHALLSYLSICSSVKFSFVQNSWNAS